MQKEAPTPLPSPGSQPPARALELEMTGHRKEGTCVERREDRRMVHSGTLPAGRVGRGLASRPLGGAFPCPRPSSHQYSQHPVCIAPGIPVAPLGDAVMGPEPQLRDRKPRGVKGFSSRPVTGVRAEWRPSRPGPAHLVSWGGSLRAGGRRGAPWGPGLMVLDKWGSGGGGKARPGSGGLLLRLPQAAVVPTGLVPSAAASTDCPGTGLR